MSAEPTPPPDAPGSTSRPRRWWREHQGVLDVIVSVAVFAYNLPIQGTAVPPGLFPGAGIVIAAGLCLPYLARRRWPLRVFGVIAAVALAQLVLGVGLLVADVMLVLALYTVASRFPWRLTLPLAAAVAVWVVALIVPQMHRDALSVGDVTVLVLVVLWAWTWGVVVRGRREQLARLEEHARTLEREQEARAAMAATRERARIAREIHDIVSHSLSAVVLMADGAAGKVRSEPERAEQAMRTVRDAARSSLAEMRRMLDVLRDDGPEPRSPQPGVGQLDRLVAHTRQTGLPVDLRVTGAAGRLSAGVDLTVYRVVQEALTNARRHGGPGLTGVQVHVEHRPDHLAVRVSDDGAGSTSPTGGHGLVGMRERVASYGGTMRAANSAGGGFEVLVELPHPSCEETDDHPGPAGR